jgi:nucleotide-binding universal stress UspA family protein
MRILVPVDGSAPSLRALAHALAIARRCHDAAIVLVNVQSAETLDVSDISAVVSAPADRQRAAERSVRELARALEMCREADVPHETISELGPVAETIDRLARQLPADQIVMGTRGHRTVRRLLLGSVAAKVVELASVPVTLIK